jgi:hypothetical protein
MFINSKKQGDAGLGQAIAFFTLKGYNVALPLTDSADCDMIVEIDGVLKKVQVKTSTQLGINNHMIFEGSVSGGNKTSNSNSLKLIKDQDWDLVFLHHLITGKQALIPKCEITTKNRISLRDDNYIAYRLN